MTTSSVDVPSTTGRVLHWAARYDLLVWLLTHGRPRAFRRTLAALARLAPGESVLDIGCGTGSLAIEVKRQVGPTGTVIGIDASPEMIARAHSKAVRARVDVTFHHAVAEALPFPDVQFDVVLSTLMLHHLSRPLRQRCAQEIRRVLRADGRALVVDFAKGQDRGSLLGHFHRHGHVDPAAITSLLTEAGLHPVRSGSVGISSLQYVLASPSA
jgi:ubiquinone/menaquinone biosynthesis C-methylase UbiE